MGKGGGSAPKDSTLRQISLPEFSEPYYERMLAGAEQSLMPFREVGTGEFDAEGNEIMRTESTYQGYGQTQIDPFTGEEVFIPSQRLASGAEIGDIVSSRGMVRDIAGSAIPGTGQSAAAFSRGIGALQNLANYAPGQFYEAQVSPYSGFQETGVSPYAGFDRASFSPYSGFQAGQASPYAGFREAQFSQYRPKEFTGFRETGVTASRFDPTRQFSGAEVSSYMSPYMEQVVSRQADEARRQFDISGAGRAAQAVQAGAFGGSRQAVQEALAEEGLQRQLGDIYAGGQQQAFESAQQAFQADRAAQFAREQAQVQEIARTQGITVEEAARVQQSRAQEAARVQAMEQQELARVEASRAAEMARVQQAQAAERARVQGISIEEAARLQQSQAGELARIQSADAGELARIQQAQAAELARVQGISVEEAARIQASQAAELARVQGISVDEAARVQAAREASRQFGAGQALAAEQAALGAAEGLFGLGERARAADIQGAQLLEAIGKDQLAERQAALDLDYQRFLEERDYPIRQYERFANLLAGLPAGFDVSTQNYQQYNPTQQALGAGISALGLYNAYTR